MPPRSKFSAGPAPGGVRLTHTVAPSVKLGNPQAAPSVAAYFLDRLGTTLIDAQALATRMSIATECGRSCAGAIDAAAALLAHVHAAYGDPVRTPAAHPKARTHTDAVVDACGNVVRCYIYG